MGVFMEFSRKYFKKIIFFVLWLLIIFNALNASLEFSETVDISKELLVKMVIDRGILVVIYGIFTFLFRKTMSESFLIANAVLWFILSIGPIVNLDLIYPNIVIFDKVTLIFNAFMIVYVFAVYIKTFRSKTENITACI